MATDKITVRPAKVRSVKCWRVRYWREGKPRREFFATKAEAVSRADELHDDRAHSGSAWLALAPAERQKLLAAFHEARERGVDLFEAIHQSDPIAKPAVQAPSVKVAIEQMVLAKKAAGRAGDYVDGLETFLLHLFKDFLPLRADRVSLAMVKDILARKSLASRATVRARLSTFFKFCMREGFREDNPCARVESISYHKPPPQVFSVKQLRRAVKWLGAKAPHGLAWFGLSTFCGLRPEEAEKTVAGRDIHFGEGFIRVEKQTTKVRQRRVVYPRAEALAFVQWALEQGGELPLEPVRRGRILAGTNGRERKAEGLRGELGWKVWPKDITRHTAASYWLGAGATAGEVSEALGNSEQVLKRDYKALVTRAEAEKFWRAVAKFSGFKPPKVAK